MRIAFISAEVVPFAKTGGLADVAGALPKVLAECGHEVIVIMPHYKQIDNEKYGIKKVTDTLSIKLKDHEIDMTVCVSDAIPNVKTYLIGSGGLFFRDGIYGHNDDEYRFTAFCLGVMELLPFIDFRPDVCHANDWHTALVPTLLKTTHKNNPFYAKTSSVFTIHNLAYQGLFGEYVLDIAGLPHELFTRENLEFYGSFNFLKAGILYSDKVTTVSETYAKEIMTEEYGEKLDGVLKTRKDDLVGIVNGIDYDIWSPKTDSYIAKKFSINDVSLKKENKRALQERFGFKIDENIPLFGLVSRLSWQKGIDVLIESLKGILAEKEIQVVFLGAGDENLKRELVKLAKKYPQKVSVTFDFDDPLSHQIYAGSDFFFMPSKYEPCGLGQLISMSYGTLVIARATGGLEDTVTNIDLERGIAGTGVKFVDMNHLALTDAIKRALMIYANKDILTASIQHAMNEDFSFGVSAEKYINLYTALDKS